MGPGRFALVLALASCRPPAAPEAPARPTDPARVLGDRCERGDGPACVEAAELQRTAGDLARAAALDRRACDLASARGCAALAAALERGDAGDASPGRALDLYVSACLGGLASACRAAADRLTDTRAAAEFRARACRAVERALCPPAAEPPPPEIDPRDRASVVSALAPRRLEFQACYLRALRGHPGLRGPVIVEVAIGADGSPRATAVREGLRAAPEVGACVAEIAAQTTYAPTTTGEIVIVPYRLVFAPQ